MKSTYGIGMLRINYIQYTVYAEHEKNFKSRDLKFELQRNITFIS